MITPTQSPRLDSWKEIAGYLGRTVRTVQRWEETEGLPVHRHLHQALGNVYAYPVELDEWVAKRQAQPSPPEPVAPKSRRWMMITATAAVVLAAVGGAWLVSRALRPSEPVWLLVTALDNRTGEPLLDESVPFLLEREISNSSRVYVAPRARVEDSLKLMRKDPNTRVDEALGREAALRDGGIRLVVSSRAERAGSAYLMTASLIDVASGRLMGSASEQAKTITEIALAVRRLASVVQRAAGDRTAGSAANQSVLQHVTTPSLRACQLYSQAYRLGTTVAPPDWETSERLAREAIAEDPQFASAHIWLAWALRNQKKPETEWRASLARAVTLSNSATDRERQFILASERSMNNQLEEAVIAYRRMLMSYPDDYWARNNLISALNRLGKTADAGPEIFRQADLRPNEPRVCYAAMSRAVRDLDLDRARKNRDRLLNILQANPEAVLDGNVLEGIARNQGRRQAIRQYAETFRLHDLWLAGRLDELRKEVDRMAVPAPPDGVALSPPATFYQTLGRFRDAEAVILRAPHGFKEQRLVLLAYLRDDPAALQEALANTTAPYYYPAVPLFALQESAKREELTQLVGGLFVQPVEPSIQPFFESRLAVLNRDAGTADRKFEESVRLPPALLGGNREGFIASAGIARVYELAGDDASALRTLQRSDAGPVPLFLPYGYSTAGDWHRIRYDEARLLRKLGRQKEAEPIEAGLRRDLRLADPDHPIVVRLKESGRRPFNVY